VLRVVALLLALAAPLAAQESVVTGISTDTIALNATFDGSELFVFGAIRRDAPTPPDADPLDVVITVKGPSGPVTVRRKARVFGIWINTDAVEVRQAPSFYAIASSRPLDTILSQTARLRYQIGMDQAVRRVEGHPTIEDTTSFTEAVVRLRERSGSYAQLDDGVSIAEETLFQTRIELPANLVEGEYIAEFFLVRDAMVISTGATLIRVEKTGIERWLYNFSRTEPLLYGLFSVALALFAGWLAAAAFQLARRR
jgi:uncharacterized protein (TIGR02186 family)